MVLKYKIRFKQNKKYKQKTLKINFDDIKDDFWKEPTVDIKKLRSLCNSWICANGGGQLLWIYDLNH